MASPQKENGYTPIAHEIIEALVRVKMSGSEWQYVMCVFRKTYGWNKKEDWCTNSQIVALTGMGKERVSEAKSRLIARNIVTENRNKICFQKDYSKWKELRKNVSKSYGKTYHELRKSVHTKETITKENKIGDKSQENMSIRAYNENQHQEDLPEIDDNGEIIKKEKKVRYYTQVYDVFKNFHLYSIDWIKNTTEQTAGDNLYSLYGIEQIEKALMLYKENKDNEFCPRIYSPSTLIRKWKQLLDFKKKNNL